MIHAFSRAPLVLARVVNCGSMVGAEGTRVNTWCNRITGPVIPDPEGRVFGLTQRVVSLA